MICRAVLLLILFSSQFALAATCKISKQSSVEVSGENFSVMMSERNKVTFVAIDQAPPDVAQQAQTLLSQTLSPTPTLLLRIRFFLEQNKELVSNESTNALYLQEVLMNSQVDYVVIETPEGNIKGFGIFASRFDPRSMGRHPEAQLVAEDINNLVLLTVGPAIYVRAREPELFNEVGLGTLDTQKVESQPKKNPVKLSHEQALEKLNRNRQSHRQLQRVARDLTAGRYRGLSNEEIRRRILGRFWRPAKKTVSDWLDSELGGSRQQNQSSSSPSILSRKGRGLAFISKDSFARLEKEIRGYCAQ